MNIKYSLNNFQKHNFYLGVLLAFVAGNINAGGFLYVGQYSSHMTGIVSSIADFLILKKFILAFLALMFFCLLFLVRQQRQF